MGSTEITIDLKPDYTIEKIKELLLKPRLKLTITNYLRKTLNLSEVTIGLLMGLKNKEEIIIITWVTSLYDKKL